MPNFDKTGPEGKGPMTGKNQGKCLERNSEPLKEKRRFDGRNRKKGGGGMKKGRCHRRCR